ncbi:sensor histidine kinase [Phycicoccus duodecadis]|uniref:sensor histidine kinase n=1 Tax=Phycicoccus duodecadis TaxID=173053 RepID=UPI000C7071BC|nr:sensor histidine kinase [Phycicoccus duodecadis]
MGTHASAWSRTRAGTVAALAAAAASVAGLAASAVLDGRAPDASSGVTLSGGPGWPYALQGAVLAALATAVLLRHPRQALGWSLAGFGAFWVLDGLAQSWVRAGLTASGAWPGMSAALWFLNRFGAFLPVVAALLLLLFPTGRFLPGRMGSAGRVALGVMALAAGVVLVAPSGDRTAGVVLPPTVDLDPTTLAVVPAAAVPVAVAVGTAAFVVPMLTVVTRYRRSTGLERDRMRWLLWAVVVMAVAMVLSLLVSEPWFDVATAFLVMTLPAAAMTVAVLAPTLAPIDQLLPRTAVWAALALLLLLVDLVAVAALGLALDGLDQTQVVAVVLLVSVLLYGPLRQRIRTWGRRLALGSRDDPYAAVASLASSLETTDDGPAQLRAVCDAVADAFGVGFVGIEVERARGERLVATHGTRPAQVRTLPIAYRDREVGRLVLPARGVRSRLTPRDERLLADLVRQAATAARTWHLAEELQDHRERLVTAREEERRRIRRDLHDGLGPALSGLVFQLESARLLLDRDPETARGRVESTTAELREVVADVRRLVHDLRPPALDDRGLVGAVAQLAERVPAVRVTVEADVPDRLPAAVEVAAYRIVAEALTNVGRHARARHCTVALGLEGGALTLEVADDGVGIGADVEVGVGLGSLRERAAELGGRAEVTCPPTGGTTVHARLPLAVQEVRP